MIPAARVAAAIEVLETADREKIAADRVLADFYRRRRYAGSKDRAAINGQVYGVTRRRIRLDWWLARLDAEGTPRSRVIADLVLVEGSTTEAVSALFDGSTHGPATLTEAEKAFSQSLQGEPLEHADAPRWVRLECPEWIAARLAPALGDRLESCLGALAEKA